MQGKIESTRKPYMTKDGREVPSVTTILSRYKESGGLIKWAWKLGMEGKSFEDVRDRAASIGTVAHEMMECHIKKKPFIAPDVDDEFLGKARNAFESFRDWEASSKLQVTHSEIRLVSDLYGYGGTIDSALVLQKRSMGDWKTSDSIYIDHIIQLAAYGNLWNENFPDDPIVGGYHLVKFSKEDGGFTHKHWRDLTPAWEAFKLMLSLYKLDKPLKQMIR